jgi:hypothetical protein
VGSVGQVKLETEGPRTAISDGKIAEEIYQAFNQSQVNQQDVQWDEVVKTSKRRKPCVRISGNRYQETQASKSGYKMASVDVQTRARKARILAYHTG